MGKIELRYIDFTFATNVRSMYFDLKKQQKQRMRIPDKEATTRTANKIRFPNEFRRHYWETFRQDDKKDQTI